MRFHPFRPLHPHLPRPTTPRENRGQKSDVFAMILGEVPEGEDAVHVLTRQFPVEGSTALELISFLRIGGEGKAMVTEEMNGMAGQPKKVVEMLEKALEMQRNSPRE